MYVYTNPFKSTENPTECRLHSNYYAKHCMSGQIEWLSDASLLQI